MANVDKDADLIIDGVTESGKTFRPSDWAERISSQLASYGPDHRLRYSDSVHPCMIDGVRCLFIKKSLSVENPAAYESILHFAAENQLRVHDDRRDDSDRRAPESTTASDSRPSLRQTGKPDRRS